jgi:hypothetical protein
MVTSVLSPIASTEPSPRVLSPANSARIFSVTGMCFCAWRTTARGLMVERSNTVRAVVDQHRRIHKVAVGVVMPDAEFGKLAGGSADRVLMAIRAGPCVVNGPSPVLTSSSSW